MGREIERKYLVVDDSWRTQAEMGSRILQGYLAIDRERTVRVRLRDGTHGRLTVKGPSTGPSRPEYEYEYEIPDEDARELLELCLQPLIDKTRHELSIDDLTWEIDVFTGTNRGLVLAEVEVDDPRTVPPRPPWLGPEVTGDPRYFNSSLVDHPWPIWGTDPSYDERA